MKKVWVPPPAGAATTDESTGLVRKPPMGGTVPLPTTGPVRASRVTCQYSAGKVLPV